MNNFRHFHLNFATGLSACLTTIFARKLNHNSATVNAQPSSKRRRHEKDLCDDEKQTAKRYKKINWEVILDLDELERLAPTKTLPKLIIRPRRPCVTDPKIQAELARRRELKRRRMVEAKRASSSPASVAPSWSLLSDVSAPSVPQSSLIPTWINYRDGGPIFPHPKIAKRHIIEYLDFAVCYDNVTRLPMWTFEVFDPHNEALPEESKQTFHPEREEERVPEVFRTRIRDYTPTFKIYKMQQLASFDLHSDTNDPCVCTNIVPQRVNGRPRTEKTVWDEFRHYMVYISFYHNPIYVLTGPLYIPEHTPNYRPEGNPAGKYTVKYECLQGKNIAVPTHFFKVILFRTDHEVGYHLECYIFENKVHESKNITKFLVSRQALERLAGFSIFEKLPNSKVSCTFTHPCYAAVRYSDRIKRRLEF